MRKFVLFAFCSAVFGCIASRAHASDYEATHPPLTFGAFAASKACDCTKGGKCDCGPNCVCVDGVGCGRKSRAKRCLG